jgi:hypothetical protein
VPPELAARWPADPGPLTYAYDAARHSPAVAGSWQAGALFTTVTYDAAPSPPDAA